MNGLLAVADEVDVLPAAHTAVLHQRINAELNRTVQVGEPLDFVVVKNTADERGHLAFANVVSGHLGIVPVHPDVGEIAKAIWGRGGEHAT